MLLGLMVVMGACAPDAKRPVPGDDRERVVPEVDLPSPTLRRLTQQQYGRAIHDFFGPEVVLPSSLEPDEAVEGLLTIGSSLTTISPLGVEQYEDAAFDIAAQVMEDPALRDELVPCTPQETFGDACAEQFFVDLGRRAWRRPLTADELDRLVGISMMAQGTLGDFYAGLSYGIAALLQSPNFLFRVELGAVDEAGIRRFTDYEMAARLSFLLWDRHPDEELLDAANAGELTTDAGLASQVERLIADERIEQGIRSYFTDMYGLYGLDDLNKDPTIFTHMSPEVGPSAREETLLGILHLVLEEDGDYRDLLTTQRAFLDKRLASIYAVRAPAREGFGVTHLDASGGRRGLTGQVSFLGGQSHAVSSSATLRGKYVRERLLCQLIPPPPSDVDASIPEPSGTAVTLRDRVAVHLEDAYCAGCHELMDPVGLGFENFDGLGHWRERENGAVIDATGEIDEAGFADAWDLAGALRDHEDLPACLVETMMAYASGHSLTSGEDEAVLYHYDGFVDSKHNVRWLLADIAMSPVFRLAGDVQ